MNTLFGQKTEQLQRFLENGQRIPVTVIRVPETSVVQLKTTGKDGYGAVQVGVAGKKAPKMNKSRTGHLVKSGAKAPLFLREIRVANEASFPQLGEFIKVEEVLEAGDIVWVTGTSKGKGFAGGVKRYGFRGGPRTHGQSDRERAPGSIGQTTTPGRVYKGKKMAGNMGNEQVTIKNLEVVSVDPETNSLMVAGLVPGLIGGYVRVVKMGVHKKFTPLLKNAKEAAIEAEKTATAEAEAAKIQAEADKIAAKEAEKAAAAEAALPVEATETATPEASVEEPKEEAK